MAVTSGITLTVPSTAEDGQFYWIRNVSGGDVTIAGTNLVGLEFRGGQHFDKSGQVKGGSNVL